MRSSRTWTLVIVIPVHYRCQPRKTVFSHYSVCVKIRQYFYAFDQYRVKLNGAKALSFEVSPVCICGFRLDRHCAWHQHVHAFARNLVQTVCFRFRLILFVRSCAWDRMDARVPTMCCFVFEIVTSIIHMDFCHERPDIVSRQIVLCCQHCALLVAVGSYYALRADVGLLTCKRKTG